MTLTKADSKAHQQACKLLKKDELTYEERLLIINDFHEGADLDNRAGGAHFTPLNLANDFAIDVGGAKILDLCAGIGTLSFAYRHFRWSGDTPPTLVCVERCARYVEVGKKLLPEAKWICGDIFDRELQEKLKEWGFSTVIGNPPFGKRLMNGGEPPRYTGKLFEYAALDIAATLADCGTFIIPQGSSPFLYSGVQCYQDIREDPHLSAMRDYRRFRDETGIELHAGCGVDTSIYRREWKGVSPAVEIVTFECFADADIPAVVDPKRGSDQLFLF